MKFDFNEEKNTLLQKKRAITFQDVIEVILKNGVLKDFKHPNSERYPNQRIFVVELNKYTYCVPYVTSEKLIFLKTIYPSRKFLYLLEDE